MQFAALKLHLLLVKLVFDDVLLFVGVIVDVLLLLFVLVVSEVHHTLRDALSRVELVLAFLELNTLSQPLVVLYCFLNI